MKLLLDILSFAGLSVYYPSIVLAHETEEVHEEPPASIDPVVAVIVVAAIAIAAFLVWKYMLKTKETSSPKPN